MLKKDLLPRSDSCGKWDVYEIMENAMYTPLINALRSKNESLAKGGFSVLLIQFHDSLRLSAEYVPKSASDARKRKRLGFGYENG